LRYALDRASYGNIVAMTHETGLYLKQLLDLFEAAGHQEVLRRQQQVGRGGAGDEPFSWGRARAVAAGQDGRKRATRVALGVRERVRHEPGPANFKLDAQTAGANAEAWIAAYRLTDEGRRFPGVAQNLRWAVGLPDREARVVSA
jgi:hypothetical protein